MEAWFKAASFCKGQGTVNSILEIRSMHPCTGTVVTRGPCFAYLRTAGGDDFHIGSPGNTAEIARFLETLKEGQSYRFPGSFLEFQEREAAKGGFQSQFYPQHSASA
jgi:hypothetical protein